MVWVMIETRCQWLLCGKNRHCKNYTELIYSNLPQEIAYIALLSI
ncbi:Uncharacterised protein [Serratia marcescens]|nr:Uncharacterised protein [Serratia marcescens]CVB09847.1 Uncharacterised protein [Serratia marcescens]CVB50131.1 Uncharacterised protein [Serratia marcescens]CVB97551.1 Uncharacterised protein [Serratia marcescens]CVC50012.1 Uncharacterised protein [Serratia marcescens]